MGNFNEKLSKLLMDFNDVFHGLDNNPLEKISGKAANLENLPLIFESLIQVVEFCLDHIKQINAYDILPQTSSMNIVNVKRAKEEATD